MGSTTWVLVAFLAAGAALLFAKAGLPKPDLPFARPEVVEAFKIFLEKTLHSEEPYYKDLISAGIVPAPPGYGNKKFSESPEMREDFNKHINDHLTSLEKLDFALKRLFGERLVSSSFTDRKDSSHPYMAEHLKSHESEEKVESSDVPKLDSRSEQASTEIDCNEKENGQGSACKDRLSDIPELPRLPEVDFVMTSESEVSSENEFVTSASVVDKIATEYLRMFSESPRLPSTSEQSDQVVTLSPLDDEFIMHVMSSSIPPSLSESSDSADESTALSEKSTQHAEEFPSSAATAPSKAEPDSIYISPIHGRVLTFEEVKLLDLSLKSELKYQVISTSRPDLNTLSDVSFFSTDETSSSKQIGKKRRRVTPRDISPEEPIFYQAPTAEKMILRYYRDIPDTNFTCENKSLPGFYADQETDCQVFHVCWPGRRESFLCPVGSLFNQRVLSCDNFNKTNCSISHAYFDVNTAFQEYDDAKAHNVTPSPDPMMKPIQNDSGTTEIVTNKRNIVELFEADLHFSEMVNKTSITELWEYVPVKAKVFVYPEPADLKKFLEEHHHHKIRKSKDVRGLEGSGEMDTEDDGIAGEVTLDDILEKRRRIEAKIIRVLKTLSERRKHRDQVAGDFQD